MDRTLSSLLSFPTKEWREGMSYWTGPYRRYRHFLQKNGEKGCHIGQDLVVFTLISYKRMEEKDVIADRTLSIVNFSTMWWHRPALLSMVLHRHQGKFQDPTRVVSSTAQYIESKHEWRNYLSYRSTHHLHDLSQVPSVCLPRSILQNNSLTHEKS